MKKFKIVLAESKYIKESIGILKDLVNEATIMISKKKLHLVEMDPANVMVIIFDLLSSVGTVWDVNKEVKFGINLNILNAVLKNAGKNDLIEISNKSKDEICVKLIGECSRDYTVPTVDISEKPTRIPNLKFASEINMPSGIFETQVNEAYTVSNSVQFKAKKGVFTVFAEGDLLKVSIDNKANDRTEIFSKGSVAKYSLDYLMKLIKCKKVSSKVRIRYSEDYPVRIDYYLLDKLNIGFILAPRVGADD